jgi:hypothetical protein
MEPLRATRHLQHHVWGGVRSNILSSERTVSNLAWPCGTPRLRQRALAVLAVSAEGDLGALACKRTVTKAKFQWRGGGCVRFMEPLNRGKIMGSMRGPGPGPTVVPTLVMEPSSTPTLPRRLAIKVAPVFILDRRSKRATPAAIASTVHRRRFLFRRQRKREREIRRDGVRARFPETGSLASKS